MRSPVAVSPRARPPAPRAQPSSWELRAAGVGRAGPTALLPGPPPCCRPRRPRRPPNMRRGCGQRAAAGYELPHRQRRRELTGQGPCCRPAPPHSRPAHSRPPHSRPAHSPPNMRRGCGLEPGPAAGLHGSAPRARRQSERVPGGRGRRDLQHGARGALRAAARVDIGPTAQTSSGSVSQ